MTWNPFSRRARRDDDLREYLVGTTPAPILSPAARAACDAQARTTITVQEAGARGAEARKKANRARYRQFHDELRERIGLPPATWSDG